MYGNQGKGQPFEYIGYQHDTVAGTYFAQAREYRADVGRFLMESFVSNIDIQMLLLAAETGEWQYCMDYLGNIQSMGAQTYEMCEDG